MLKIKCSRTDEVLTQRPIHSQSTTRAIIIISVVIDHLPLVTEGKRALQSLSGQLGLACAGGQGAWLEPSVCTSKHRTPTSSPPASMHKFSSRHSARHPGDCRCAHSRAAVRIKELPPGQLSAQRLPTDLGEQQLTAALSLPQGVALSEGALQWDEVQGSEDPGMNWLGPSGNLLKHPDPQRSPLCNGTVPPSFQRSYDD